MRLNDSPPTTSHRYLQWVVWLFLGVRMGVFCSVRKTVGFLNLTLRTLRNLRLHFHQLHFFDRLPEKRGTKVNIISYADDFIITGATREILESEVTPS